MLSRRTGSAPSCSEEEEKQAAADDGQQGKGEQACHCQHKHRLLDQSSNDHVFN